MPARRSASLATWAALVLLSGLAAGCGSSSAPRSATSSPAPATTSPPAPTVLAPADTGASGQPVDGISCQSQEQVVYHIHAHLAIYFNGAQRIVPQGIGIAPPRQEEQSAEGPFVVGGSCFYWLHVHTPDGVIHIESPDQRVYTLGQFFDEWRQPLSATGVGPARGKVTAFVDGRPFSGDPRSIKLLSHRQIQLDVGTPVVPPQQFAFPAGL